MQHAATCMHCGAAVPLGQLLFLRDHDTGLWHRVDGVRWYRAARDVGRPDMASSVLTAATCPTCKRKAPVDWTSVRADERYVRC